MKNVDGSDFTSGEPYVDYQFVIGPFINVFIESWNDPENMHTLLIEELNRADSAAVFGDMFQLLDRDSDGTSIYAIQPSKELYAVLTNARLMDIIDECHGMKLPSNMNIVATMNSADQGVNVLDTAFKRRWSYKYMKIDMKLLPDNKQITYAGNKVKWRDFLSRINEKLQDSFDIEEDRLLGPYFVDPECITDADDESTKNAVRKVLFYLWDDVLRHRNRKEIFGNIKSLAQLMDKYETEDVLGINLPADSGDN